MSNDVTYVREEVELWAGRWKKARDVDEGEERLKSSDLGGYYKTGINTLVDVANTDKSQCGMPMNQRYLPMINPTDLSYQNIIRNYQYIIRAYFFGATARTKNGMVGIAFNKPPAVSLPSSMEVLLDDVDGAGTGLINQSQGVVEETLLIGRDGLLTDYPARNEAVSVAEQEELAIHATIRSYRAEHIINWRIGANRKPSLIVLQETTEVESDYGTEQVDQWRELRMVEGVYQVKLWQQDSDAGLILVDEFTPTKGDGSTWNEIPFSFVGAMDNNAEIDKAPLLDIVNANLAHYRNSADYQDAVFYTGQPQVWVTGADSSWMKEMQEAGIYFGSRAIGSAPMGGSVTLLQAQANMAARESMQDIKEDMVSLGAMLLTPGTVAKTAEQSSSETAASHSVLSLTAQNVSDAYYDCLVWAAEFMNADSSEIVFEINTQFVGMFFDPQQADSIVRNWQAGAIPTSDKNRNLKQLGLIDPEKTDDEIETELEMEGGGLDLTDPAVDDPVIEEEPEEEPPAE